LESTHPSAPSTPNLAEVFRINFRRFLQTKINYLLMETSFPEFSNSLKRLLSLFNALSSKNFIKKIKENSLFPKSVTYP